MPDWAKDHSIKNQTGTLIHLYVQPGASKTAWKGEFPSAPPRLKLAVSASPTEGAANEMVIRFIAESLSVPKSRVHLISGEAARQKNVWVEGIDALTVEVRLDDHLD